MGCDSDRKSRGRKGLQVDICTDFNDIFTVCAFLVIYLKLNGPKLTIFLFSLELYSLQTRNTKIFHTAVYNTF